jgi:hypothetical protein
MSCARRWPGCLWTQLVLFYYDVNRWLEGTGQRSVSALGEAVTAQWDQWHHMYNADVISMPDKWEYPGTPRGISPSKSCR